jgi:hypothetical protein
MPNVSSPRNLKKGGKEGVSPKSKLIQHQEFGFKRGIHLLVGRD